MTVFHLFQQITTWVKIRLSANACISLNRSSLVLVIFCRYDKNIITLVM